MILMGRVVDSSGTASKSDSYTQQSMILVPMDTPGVTVVRALGVFGYDDAPHGHCEVKLTNVRVPAENILLGEGRGFEIAQGRLGPGRLHHCMRAIGVASRCLDAHIDRALTRVAFGKRLAELGKVRHDIAESRRDIEQARLLTLSAAAALDKSGQRGARDRLALVKFAVPSLALAVIDRAIQAHGGAGVSQDFLLAYAYASTRTLRIADGPDEVHARTVSLFELKRRSKL
jgi:acyl-CoA dehydrogenase